MKMWRLGLAAITAISSIGRAGPLYGTVRGLGPLPPNLTVSVACPSFANAREHVSGGVDAHGSFAVRVRSNGRCEMRADSGGRTGVPFQVFVSDNPLRYDFSVDGQLNRVP